MGLTATDYRGALLSLLPPGPAWSRDPGTAVARLFLGLAEELARVDAGGLELIEEADPRTSNQLLSDWERVTGIVPAVGATLAQRRAAVVGQITAIGGQSRAYFSTVAASLGYTITITEFIRHTVMSPVNVAINGIAWPHSWRIDATPGPSASTAAAFDALFQRIKPAHTTLYIVHH